MISSDLILSVSDFVAVFNQTIEYAYPSVTVQGELANFRVSKNRWVYFDLKDEYASVKFFGTVYHLPGPLEDGLILQVSGNPRLHPQYGFSINIQSVQPVGEGSIKRAMALLQAKLEAEGLFDESRKRLLPYPPRRVGLIASSESAAYHDFIKILNERWGGVDIELADVQVQGDASPGQLIAALEYFNTHENPVDVIVMTRGGGSPEDLAAFSTEQVTRAVAASRIPTLVAIGHEIDISLAELAADQRASTPSNAAQILTPDKRHELERVADVRGHLGDYLQRSVDDNSRRITDAVRAMAEATGLLFADLRRALSLRGQVLSALSPTAALQRGYAIIMKDGRAVRSSKQLEPDDIIKLRMHDGDVEAKVT